MPYPSLIIYPAAPVKLNPRTEDAPNSTGCPGGDDMDHPTLTIVCDTTTAPADADSNEGIQDMQSRNRDAYNDSKQYFDDENVTYALDVLTEGAVFSRDMSSAVSLTDSDNAEVKLECGKGDSIENLDSAASGATRFASFCTALQFESSGDNDTDRSDVMQRSSSPSESSIKINTVANENSASFTDANISSVEHALEIDVCDDSSHLIVDTRTDGLPQSHCSDGRSLARTESCTEPPSLSVEIGQSLLHHSPDTSKLSAAIGCERSTNSSPPTVNVANYAAFTDLLDFSAVAGLVSESPLCSPCSIDVDMPSAMVSCSKTSDESAAISADSLMLATAVDADAAATANGAKEDSHVFISTVASNAAECEASSLTPHLLILATVDRTKGDFSSMKPVEPARPAVGLHQSGINGLCVEDAQVSNVLDSGVIELITSTTCPSTAPFDLEATDAEVQACSGDADIVMASNYSETSALSYFAPNDSSQIETLMELDTVPQSPAEQISQAGITVSSCPISDASSTLGQDEQYAELSGTLESAEELGSLLPSSPLLSSPPLPSSSPPRVFSSSPPPMFESSPPSSPAPSSDFNCLLTAPGVGLSTTAGFKRSWDDDEQMPADIEFACSPESSEKQSQLAEESARKRTKPDVEFSPYRPPNPKRPTQASQRRQYKKLIAPFRSPLLDKDSAHGGVEAVYASGRYRETKSQERRAGDVVSRQLRVKSSEQVTSHDIPKVERKDYTLNAAKQFKSPIATDSSMVSSPPSQPRNGPAMSNVQAIARIRSLQAKLQTLKQAVRIKNSANGDEDEQLEQLASKWTAVGREVAWAVWDTVKDLDPGESMHVGTGSFAAGWGFDEGAGSSRSKPSITRSWGWEEDVKGPANGSGGGKDQEDSHADDEAEVETDTAPKHTVGTMLRHLGIAPETLGWDENEGDFVDDH